LFEKNFVGRGLLHSCGVTEPLGDGESIRLGRFILGT
jgi:hypothetical protein